MAIEVKMEDAPIEEKAKNASSLNKDDKLELIKSKFSHAKSILPEYEEFKKEIQGYEVYIPESFTEQDLPQVNKLYSITQEFSSRVHALEHIAIDNHTRWERLHNLMFDYIQDLECGILISEEVINLKNSSIQKAFVRNKLKAQYNVLSTIKDYLMEAESFSRIIQSKKKDLSSILTNLTRQVKVLKSELELIRPLKS